MEKLYTLTRAREQQGRATRVDTLRVELKRGQAQSRLENNRETLYSLTRDFAQLLGVGLETEFDLEAPPLLDIAVTSDTEAVTTALANRLDYAQVLQDYHARHRAARIARRGLYPDVALVISREQGGAGADLGHAFDRDDTDWFAGLAGDFDLNQHANQLTYQQAELDTDSAAQTIRIRVLTITREVLQGLSRYRRAGADLRIEERNLALAQNRSALAQHLYQAGRGDNFSVTDAEDARVQAESKYLKAQAEVVVTGYDLLRCLGTLLESPDELKPAAAGARRDG
jgi:outer membrane protein TolC